MLNDYVKTVDTTSMDTVSVTELIEQYKQPFDADFWSKYKALEQLCGELLNAYVAYLTQKKKIEDKILTSLNVNKDTLEQTAQEIRQEWESKKEEAQQKGILLHIKLEGTEETMEKDPDSGIAIVRSTDIIPNTDACYYELPVSYIDTENNLLLLGQIDNVIIQNNNVIVQDYKTGKEIKKNSRFNKETKQFKMMQYPVHNLKDSNFYHYSLLLSFYAWILKKKNPELTISKLQIIHYDDNMKKKTYDAEYLENEVCRIIKDYIRKQKIKKANEKNRRFQY